MLRIAAHWLKVYVNILTDAFDHETHPLMLGTRTDLVCLLFYFLATSHHIGTGTTCNSAHSWQLNSAATLGNQATSAMTWYLTITFSSDWTNKSLPALSWYCWAPGTEDTGKYILVIDLNRPGYESVRLNPPISRKWEMDAQLIWPSLLVNNIFTGILQMQMVLMMNSHNAKRNHVKMWHRTCCIVPKRAVSLWSNTK